MTASCRKHSIRQWQREKPYLVPYGGSVRPGALGYAFAMGEILEQGIRADWIVFATSSGGTHAGLVLGQRLFGFEGKVLGISIDESAEWLKNHVSALASSASELLGPRIEFDPADVLANDNYCRAGYGVLTDSELGAIHLVAEKRGIIARSRLHRPCRGRAA